jgi:ubiquinone/menaquinone biosynthesis C-methylase UbiE
MSEVERYYSEIVQREWERMERHRTEFAVTLRALSDYLPQPPVRIADIGGGPGRYAIALAQRGYVVTLVDLAEANLEFARYRADEAEVTLAGYVHANALDLAPLPSESFDVALLMGPLYHLLEVDERRQAVREAARVLKPGGLIFAAFITRYAPIRWAAKNVPAWIAEQPQEFEHMVTWGVQRIAAGTGRGFTDAYFSHPSEIVPLLEQGGFETLDLVACEGVVSMIDEKLNELSGEAWDAWVELNYRLGRDPSVHGAAEHLLYIGRKQA